MTSTNRRLLLKGAGAAAAVFALPQVASARPVGWPKRPIQIIVTGPPGGGTDIIARRIGLGLSPILNTSVVVINRPGASGLIGLNALVNAAPNGYTLGYLYSGLLALQVDGAKVNMVTDVTPISQIGATPFCFAVRAKSPYRTLAQLLAAIEKSPGKLSYADGGAKSPSHFVFAKLALRRPGLNAQEIPYNSAGDAAVATVSGQVDFISSVLTSVEALARAGQLRILAIADNVRYPSFPNVPTVAEAANLPGYRFVDWSGIFGPANLPSDIVGMVHDALGEVTSAPDFVKFMTEIGSRSVSGKSPSNLATLVKDALAETQELYSKLDLGKS